MRIISHRGNLDGPNPKLENSSEYIIDAINQGFDVEIDIWYINDKFYLGHDIPQYEIEMDWILNLQEKLWVHCKNIDCIDLLYNTNINYFWHDLDKTTITSKGYPWSQPNVHINNGITVCLEYKEVADIYGVCTDYPIKFKN
jgi:hypothetical protein